MIHTIDDARARNQHHGAHYCSFTGCGLQIRPLRRLGRTTRAVAGAPPPPLATP